MPYTITWPAYTVPRGAVRFVLSAPLSFNLQWDVKVAQRVGSQHSLGETALVPVTSLWKDESQLLGYRVLKSCDIKETTELEKKRRASNHLALKSVRDILELHRNEQESSPGRFFPLKDNDQNIRRYSCVFLIPPSSSYRSCVHIFAIVSTKEKFGTYYTILRKKIAQLLTAVGYCITFVPVHSLLVQERHALQGMSFPLASTSAAALNLQEWTAVQTVPLPAFCCGKGQHTSGEGLRIYAARYSSSSRKVLEWKPKLKCVQGWGDCDTGSERCEAASPVHVPRLQPPAEALLATTFFAT
ncbi:hypothetical protein Anapl_07118 [Anas platyrhynchos]|uniref:Uncharacterized protein n=1 Tax=Anas platyrhynchos TaxID=8839 RepID=R0K3C5_ANAPL|nr:hypothetical protein Anapl_07118 [Anas platyrhynchos]